MELQSKGEKNYLNIWNKEILLLVEQLLAMIIIYKQQENISLIQRLMFQVLGLHKNHIMWFLYYDISRDKFLLFKYSKFYKAT